MKYENYSLLKIHCNFNSNDIIKISSISKELNNITIDIFMLNRIEKLSHVSDKFKDYYEKLDEIIKYIKRNHLPIIDILTKELTKEIDKNILTNLMNLK